MPQMTTLFTAHLNAVNEGYWQHARVAAGIALTLAAAALAALVHAVLPMCFERTASTLINRLHARMQSRH